MENKVCILLVDDNDIDRLIGNKMTEMLFPNYCMKCFASGQELTNYLLENNSDDQIENIVLLVDMYMPDQNGFEVIQEVQKIQSSSNIKNVFPFLLSAAVHDNSISEHISKLGIIDIISKPVTQQKLQVISSFLD